MSQLHKNSFISCNKAASHVCHACQLGKHVRLPFARSTSISVEPFQLIHCDLWTSSILSNSSFQYYLVIVDDYSHFMWTFPLRKKSDTAGILLNFVAYIRTQFSRTLVAMQADNGTEFINSTVTSFFSTHDIHLRFSCPYTSAQNGKAERAIRTINDITHTLLFQSSMPP
uniref:Integrase catalytic domain-containing protein n=1 Tax=Triticum urartu TaxID=4572 RepID=A0A8R7TR30_TRIUA